MTGMRASGDRDDGEHAHGTGWFGGELRAHPTRRTTVYKGRRRYSWVAGTTRRTATDGGLRKATATAELRRERGRAERSRRNASSP